MVAELHLKLRLREIADDLGIDGDLEVQLPNF